MDKIEAEALNKILAEKYGKFADKPLIRLIWSTDRLEYREAEFKVESPAGFDLDLGTVVETRQVPVYDYAPNRWVLEVLLGKDDLPPEFKSAKNLDYWPLWIFWDSRFQTFADDGYYTPVEPDLGEIDRMVYYARHGSLHGHRPTEKQLFEQDKLIRAKRVAHFREQLDEEIPDTANALVHGHGDFFDSTKQKGWENEDVSSEQK